MKVREYQYNMKVREYNNVKVREYNMKVRRYFVRGQKVQREGSGGTT